jgi:hypothetical protein
MDACVGFVGVFAAAAAADHFVVLLLLPGASWGLPNHNHRCKLVLLHYRGNTKALAVLPALGFGAHRSDFEFLPLAQHRIAVPIVLGTACEQLDPDQLIVEGSCRLLLPH